MEGGRELKAIAEAIRHGAEAGKLRAFVRKNGETGLAGLVRLADRHSELARTAMSVVPAR